jgi:CopA family copper-resistance protein
MNRPLSKGLYRGVFAAAAGLIVPLALTLPTAAQAAIYNISVDHVTIDTGDFKRKGVGYNGVSPGPALRFREGEDVVINVTNNLEESTSIHWHGLILPYNMDGVPTVSFAGIEPGETFTYKFKTVQSGTYWYHSHSGFQEPDGAYGAIIIEPKVGEPFRYDRDYVIQLTDPHPDSGARILRNLEMMPDYYNRQQQTVGDFFKDVGKNGLKATISQRMAWGKMRMTAADVEDVQGFTPVINGKSTAQNWTGIFKPGEKVRLRFINSSAMTYFDIRISGLEMTVIQADSNNVQPVKVDEFRIAVAETYDVIVQPSDDRAYAIFAESMGRTASVRGTLAPRENMVAKTPELRQPPLLRMADMGI